MQLEEPMDFLAAWLQENQPRMVEVLGQIVNIDSFSHQPEGVQAVRAILQQVLEQSGIAVTALDENDSHALLASVGSGSEQNIFLTGHMDTVFKGGTVKERPFRIEGDQAFGPGVADMKSGLVMNVFVLMAFHELNAVTPLPFRVNLFFTADEEIGSPKGRTLIEKYLKPATAVFNAEPGRVSGNVVKSRKGGGTYQIAVTGVASHSGVCHQDGASAIEALARIISAVHQLTDYEQGITTNVGVIEGGTTPNTVAPFASAKVDVRFMRLDQVAEIEALLEQCVAGHGLQGARAVLSKIAGFLPFEEHASESLLALYKQQAAKIGLSVDGEFTGGCSDAGWTSAMGIPTLCATGPVGAYAHTERETCFIDTFAERATVVARCCLTL
ncbi:M20 family metallopeptidase [Vibrio sp. H11]|uniref:M20 family metallopeptidase n=1 Tax=Vibrio sp. H11 TaxID=2565928 RepID=UPI00197DCC0D|nr:M20 family metallopeptidase [Vibrio sp. H11]